MSNHDLPNDVETMTRIETAEILVTDIKRILAGHEPAVQAAVLGELVATLLACHARELRDDILDHHIAMVRELTAVVEGFVFGGAGHPGSRP